VTMKDVAAAAGVSSASVSYAYSRPHKLSPTQREHVLSVARRLGYTGPHPSASSLRKGSTGAVGLLITDWLDYAFEDPATIALLRGIAQVSHMADVSLTLVPGGRLVEPSTSDETDWPAVRRSAVDGFIVYSLPDHHPAVSSAVDRKLPLVIIDSPRVPDVPFIGIDDTGGARAAAEHLLALGHRKIGVLVDRLRPDGHRGFASRARARRALDGVARDRLQGIDLALRAAKVAPASVPVVEAGGFLFDEARWAAETLLDRHQVTAILATTDVLALTAMTVLSERGVSVPGEISVIGFDDIPAAEPAGLTTIRQPLIEKGRRGAETLLQAINGEAVGTVILPTTLIPRTSTAPPPE
jgi:DNA-binding LacI/PurR family transcriptional regulator